MFTRGVLSGRAEIDHRTRTPPHASGRESDRYREKGLEKGRARERGRRGFFPDAPEAFSPGVQESIVRRKRPPTPLVNRREEQGGQGHEEERQEGGERALAVRCCGDVSVPGVGGGVLRFFIYIYIVI